MVYPVFTGLMPQKVNHGLLRPVCVRGAWFDQSDQKVRRVLPERVYSMSAPGDKLSCRKPAGRATEQSLSVGVSSIQRHITQGSSHYGHQGLRISRNRGPDTDQKEEDMATSNRGCSKGNLRKVQLRSRSKKEINASVNTRIGNLSKRLEITDNKYSCVFLHGLHERWTNHLSGKCLQMSTDTCLD